MAGIIFTFAGGHASAVNNLIGSSVSLDNNSEIVATVQGFGVGANIVETYSGLVSDLDTTSISAHADDIAKRAGVLGAGVGIFSVYAKILNQDRWGELNLGDVITLAGAIATLTGATPLAAGLAIAGLGYTLYDLAKNGYPLPNNTDPYKNLNKNGKAHGYDPLILNLDGKGIQTLAPSSISARFDHDADGIATATGWVATGNGILALDLDGNGKIDSGKEIFGNNTLLSNGATAKDGYVALANLDTNRDNLISQADELFGRLQVWQDLNQDGISQENELFTLQALGIQSLNLEHKETNQDLGGGNRLTHIGSYTKTDGTTGMMGDAELASNDLYSRYTDKIELTPEQLLAPNLQGLGRLRDLREAAALSADLGAVLEQYRAADTKQVQMALLSDLISKWGATDPKKSDISTFSLSSDLILTENEGIALTPSQIAAWRNGLVLDTKTVADFQVARHKIAILDAFTGENSQTLYYGSHEQARQIIDTVNQTYDSLSENIYKGLLFQTRLQPYLNEIGFKLDDNQQFVLDYTDVMAKFQQVFKDDAQKAFVDLGEFLAFGSAKDWTAGMALLADFAKQGKASGQLENWLDVLGVKAANILAEQNGGENADVLQAVGLLGRDVLNGQGGNDRLIVGGATAILNGGSGSDVYEFHQGFGETTIHNSDMSENRRDVIRLHGVNKEGISYTRHGTDLVIHVAGESNSITVSNMFAGDVLTQHIDAIAYDGGEIGLAEIKETLLRGTDGNDFLQGYGDDDIVYAGLGDDRIETYNGNDTIYAGFGNDNIDAGGGNDLIYLGTDNNRAYGGDGDDTIVSGSLNDVLEGGMGSDTYIFTQQFGQDTVLNFNPNQQDVDILKFTHAKSSDVHIHRQDLDLLITQKDGQQITVQNFFEQDGKGSYTVQALEFADGQRINTEQLRQWVTSPTRHNDTLYAYADGGKIYGGDGDDTLIGNIGVDYLVGGNGHDTLQGGQNTDRLEGGAGNDTYLFNLGDGQDRIYDSFGHDTLKFGTGIQAQDLWFSRTGRDLSIQVLGKEDNITVEGWFNIIPRRIETVSMSDGSVLTGNAVQQLIQAMSTFAPQQNSDLSMPEQMQQYMQQIGASAYWQK